MFHFFMQLNLKLLLVLVVFGFLMGKTRQMAYGNFSKKAGGYFIMDFFNLIGTPVHELGHLFFGLLFGFHIDKICLFRSTKRAMVGDHTLGYVRMHKKGTSLFQKALGNIGQFFVGIGPLILGPGVIYGSSLLLPSHLRQLPQAFRTDLKTFSKALHQLTGTDIILLFIFLYIIIGISLNIELSRQDLSLAYGGLFLLEVLFFVVSALAYWLHWDLDAGINILFRWNLMISSIGILCSFLANLISLL